MGLPEIYSVTWQLCGAVNLPWNITGGPIESAPGVGGVGWGVRWWWWWWWFGYMVIKCVQLRYEGLVQFKKRFKRTHPSFLGTISCLFPKEPEPAFCAYKFWESIGYAVPFAYSKYLCTSTKLWVVLVVTVIAACCFIALDKPSCTKKRIYGTVTQDDTSARAEYDQRNTSL